MGHQAQGKNVKAGNSDGRRHKQSGKGKNDPQKSASKLVMAGSGKHQRTKRLKKKGSGGAGEKRRGICYCLNKNLENDTQPAKGEDQSTQVAVKKGRHLKCTADKKGSRNRESKRGRRECIASNQQKKTVPREGKRVGKTKVF